MTLVIITQFPLPVFVVKYLSTLFTQTLCHIWKIIMFSLITNLGFVQSDLNNKTQTDVILLDFCKAFDKVSHCLLLHKLDHYGIRGPTFEWISFF